MLSGFNTYKRTGSLLMLVMYLGFLCFQVRHNLEVGRSVLRSCKLNVSWQMQGNTAQVNAHAKHTVIAKTKSAPTKRFHPNMAAIEPLGIRVELVTPVPAVTAVYTQPFFEQKQDKTSPLRGPPAA